MNSIHFSMKTRSISSTRTAIAVGFLALIAIAAAAGVVSMKNKSGFGFFGGPVVPGYGTPGGYIPPGGYTSPSGYVTPGYTTKSLRSKLSEIQVPSWIKNLFHSKKDELKRVLVFSTSKLEVSTELEDTINQYIQTLEDSGDFEVEFWLLDSEDFLSQFGFQLSDSTDHEEIFSTLAIALLKQSVRLHS